MMRGRWVRFLTALAVVSISALAMYRGSDIVRFALADAGRGPDGKTADADRPWVNVSGLAFSAQESLLKGEADAGDQKAAAKQREELKGILTVRPLSSEYWLALSEMRLATGEPISKVAEAFSLSVLTGADEDYVMSRRGVFGLLHWEVLPGDIRQRAAADLVAVSVTMRNSDILRAALFEKTEKIRQDIRAALQAEGISAAQLAAIGL
jgi:hypothetical protein